MRRRAILLLTLVAAVLLASSGVVLAQQGEARAPLQERAESHIPNQYIVVLEDSDGQNVGQRPREVANEMAQENGLGLRHVYEHALNGFAATIPEPRLEAVRSDPRVKYISEDREERVAAQEMPKGVDRIDAEKSPTAAITPPGGPDPDSGGSVNVDVAVLDTGIYTQHTDLDVQGGYNCTSQDRSAYSDKQGHGTHVAGTVAAKDNDQGVVGVAPGARLWAIKTLGDDGSGTTSDHICGLNEIIRWNTDGDPATPYIEVANYSGVSSGGDDGNCGRNTQGTGANDAKHEAYCNLVGTGTTAVAAAGNANTNFNAQTPAAYNEVLTVTAMADYNGQAGGEARATCGSDRNERDDTAADFSNFTTVGGDDEGHTIDAPGKCINSTYPGSRRRPGGAYATLSGTSMASPHVAGMVALCIVNGACSDANIDGKAAPEAIDKLRGDAQNKSSFPGAPPPYYAEGYFGYDNDPNYPRGTRYYGHLAYAGGY